MSLVLMRTMSEAREEPTSRALGRRLLPILLIQAYLWLTLLLYWASPWNWPMRDPGKLYGFVTLCHFALLGGYLCFIHRRPRSSPKADNPTKLVYWALIANFLVLPITSYARTGNVIPDIVGSLADPGKAYYDAHVFTESGTNAGSYLRILASPLLLILFPLAAFYWGKLSRGMKWGVVMVGFATILLSVATGQRRDIADLLVTMPFIVLASHWAKITVVKAATWRLLTVGTLTAFAAFLVYFAYSHISRVGADTASYAVNPATMQHPNWDNPMLQAVPEEARPGFLAFANYLTTGYYGLSLSLDREPDHQSMYGFGHSMFLTRQYARLANDENFEHNSLPVEISDKDGFRYPILWCTAYPYFLNDLGSWGTILLMFGFGALLAISWTDVLSGRSPYGVVMFWMMTILVFYLPATNRMLQDGEGVAGFYVWLVAYLRGRSISQEVSN